MHDRVGLGLSTASMISSRLARSPLTNFGPRVDRGAVALGQVVENGDLCPALISSSEQMLPM